MAKQARTPDPPEDELILDLRDLLTPKRIVRTSAGDFPLAGVELLDPLAATKAREDLNEGQRLVGVLVALPEDSDEYDATAKALHECEDAVLAAALPGSEREERDHLAPPERTAIMAAFFGAADDAALAVAGSIRQAMSQANGSTGVRSSPASKRSTAATRRAG